MPNFNQFGGGGSFDQTNSNTGADATGEPPTDGLQTKLLELSAIEDDAVFSRELLALTEGMK